MPDPRNDEKFCVYWFAPVPRGTGEVNNGMVIIEPEHGVFICPEDDHYWGMLKKDDAILLATSILHHYGVDVVYKAKEPRQ